MKARVSVEDTRQCVLGGYRAPVLHQVHLLRMAIRSTLTSNINTHVTWVATEAEAKESYKELKPLENE